MNGCFGYDSKFDLVGGRSDEYCLPTIERPYTEMTERIEEASKVSLIETPHKYTSASNSDPLKGRCTEQNPPKNADSFESTDLVDSDDCDEAGSAATESDSDEVEFVPDNEIYYPEDLMDSYVLQPNRTKEPVNETKLKSIIAVVMSFAPITLGAGIFYNGSMAGSSSLIDLGAQLTLCGVALLTGGTLSLQIIKDEEELIGFNEID